MSMEREILEKVRALQPFPAVVNKVVALLSDPHVSEERIVETMRYDQAITANVLKLCNSTLLAGTERVSSLKEAIGRIEHKDLVHVVLSAGGGDVLQREIPGYGLARGELWKHSIMCALLAESLCDLFKYERQDKAFTGGLLHDVGKVILSEFVGRKYLEISQTVSAGGIAFTAAEEKILGINHAEVGGLIGAEWNFDEELVGAIRFHHAPEKGGGGALACIVHLSDALCLMSGIGGGADGLRYKVNTTLLKELGVGPPEFEKGLIRLVEANKVFHGILAMYE